MGNYCSSFDSCLYPKVEPAKDYSLKILEPRLVVEVVKRMPAKDMVRMQGACKWIHQLVKENRHSFIKDVSKLVEIDMANHQHTRLYCRDLLMRRKCCRFINISLKNFKDKEADLQDVLKIFQEAHIFGNMLILDKSPAVKELLAVLAPKELSLYSSGKIEENISVLLGKSRKLSVSCGFEGQLDVGAVKDYLKRLAEKQSRQRFALLFDVDKDFSGLDEPSLGFHSFEIELKVPTKQASYSLVMIETNFGLVVARLVYDCRVKSLQGEPTGCREVMAVWIRTVSDFEENFLTDIDSWNGVISWCSKRKMLRIVRRFLK